MASSRGSVEYLTLVQCTGKLSNGISRDPVKVAQKLFELFLVSQAQVTKSLSQSKDEHTKASVLVNEITRSVGEFPERFETFLNILSECLWLQDEVKHVRRQYEENKAKTEAIPASPEDTKGT